MRYYTHNPAHQQYQYSQFDYNTTKAYEHPGRRDKDRGRDGHLWIWLLTFFVVSAVVLLAAYFFVSKEGRDAMVVGGGLGGWLPLAFSPSCLCQSQPGSQAVTLFALSKQPPAGTGSGANDTLALSGYCLTECTPGAGSCDGDDEYGLDLSDLSLFTTAVPPCLPLIKQSILEAFYNQEVNEGDSYTQVFLLRGQHYYEIFSGDSGQLTFNGCHCYQLNKSYRNDWTAI